MQHVIDKIENLMRNRNYEGALSLAQSTYREIKITSLKTYTERRERYLDGAKLMRKDKISEDNIWSYVVNSYQNGMIARARDCNALNVLTDMAKECRRKIGNPGEAE